MSGMYCQSVSYPQFKKKNKIPPFLLLKKTCFSWSMLVKHRHSINSPSNPYYTSHSDQWYPCIQLDILYIYIYIHITHTRYIHIYHHISTHVFFVKSLFLLLKSPWLLVKSFFVPRFNHHVCWWNHHFRYLQFAKSPFSNKVGPFSLPSGYD